MKRKMWGFCIILGIMFVCSMLLLGAITTLVWKMDGNSHVLSIGIILTYILSNIIGGFLTGKMMGHQKFFWGVVTGVAYFLILVAVGVLLMGTELAGNMQVVSCGLMCVVSGMLGGMLAPAQKS